MDNGLVVLKLQELGLKVTHNNLKTNRWTDVKHLDGHTYGYIINTNKNICSWTRRGTDEKGCFVLDAKPFTLPYKSFKQQLHQEHKKEQQAYFDKATDLAKYYFGLQDVGSSTPYLDRKRVRKYNCKSDVEGNVIIPLRILVQDKNGLTNAYIKTIQTIKPDGSKLLAKGGQKKGAMGLLNIAKQLLPKPCNKAKMDEFTGEIIVAEGYATAATIAQLTNYLTIMAIDAGNIKEVVKQVRLAYPKARIIIAADNDLKLKETSKDSNQWVWSNVGVEAAVSCQIDYMCEVVIPDFSYVENMGLKINKKLTDWNDLATESGFSIAAKIFFMQSLVSIEQKVRV